MERLSTYEEKDWRVLHHAVMEHQTDSFVWEETDWSDSIKVVVTLKGDARVGCALKAIATATSPKGVFPVTYEWYSNDELDGAYELIESAKEEM